LYAIGGIHWFVWGGLVSSVLLWHGTFFINSLAHVWGSRRYPTTDTSRNNFWLALITMGEGWHNNHHYYQSTANQGFFWWEVDCSYYILKMLSWVGVVWDLRTPPAHILAGKEPVSDAVSEVVSEAISPPVPPAALPTA
jgi:stearoyl-CoA desaturase (delta-9 desaturase)